MRLFSIIILAVFWSSSAMAIRYVNTEMPNANFSHKDLSGARFSNVELMGSNFYGSNLTNAEFANADLSNTDFRGANLQGARFSNVELNNANLTGADLTGATMVNVDLRGAVLTNSNFEHLARASNLDMDAATVQGNSNRSAVAHRNTTVNTQATSVEMNGGGISVNTPGTSVVMGPGGIRVNTPGANVNMGDGGVKVATAGRPVMDSETITEKLTQSPKKSVDLTVNFAFDSDQIEREGHKQIYEIAEALRSEALRGKRIRIEGHTDYKGTDSYNRDLSYRRATSVAHELSSKYAIESRRFDIQGYGESRPVATNKTDAGRALNRRVTLVNLGQ